MGSVAFHPIFELLEMFGIFEIRDRNLVRTPGPLHRLAVHELWPGPAFWCTEHDHRPTRSLRRVCRGTRCFLDLLYLCQDRIKRASQTLMHLGGDVAFREIWFIAVAADQVGQFLPADAREHGRICDLEPVEMKNRKNRTITCWIQKLIGVPTRRKRSRLRLTVADNARNDKIRVIECGA